MLELKFVVSHFFISEEVTATFSVAPRSKNKDEEEHFYFLPSARRDKDESGWLGAFL